MNDRELLRRRFLRTLHIVAREARQLAWSRERLYAQPIDAEWVRGLEQAPETAETLEAFVSRFGRMQDTMVARLLPQWLAMQAETVGSAIEVLNRAERLGVVADAQAWLEARNLRNRLVHDYMDDPVRFAEDLGLARGYCEVLFECERRIRRYVRDRMGIPENELPADAPPH